MNDRVPFVRDVIRAAELNILVQTVLTEHLLLVLVMDYFVVFFCCVLRTIAGLYVRII